MLKSLCLVMLFVSASLAFSVSTLNNATTSLGLLPQPLFGGDFYALKYYKFWVPHNAYDVTIDFNNLDSSCTYLHIYMSNTLPCSKTVSPSGDYFCDNSYDPGNGVSGNNTYSYNPTTEQTNWEWRVNSWNYIAIGRYSTYNETCTYSLKTTVSVCAAEEVGFYYSAIDSFICVPYVNATVLAPITVTGLPNTAAFFGFFQVLFNTAYLRGSINSTSANLAVVGSSYGAPYSGKYVCATGSPTQDGSFFLYELYCGTPRAGEFIFWLFDAASSAETYDMTLSLEIKTCAAGLAGWNCTDTISKWVATDSGSAVVLAPNTYRYYYLDFTPNNGEGIDIQVSVNQSSLFMVRPLGFPYDDNGGYEYSEQRERVDSTSPSRRVITAEDTYSGGRWYFAVGNDNSNTPLSFTLSANITQDTNANVPTSPTEATGVKPTEEESSNFALVSMPSALIVALLALMASFF